MKRHLKLRGSNSSEAGAFTGTKWLCNNPLQAFSHFLHPSISGCLCLCPLVADRAKLMFKSQASKFYQLWQGLFKNTMSTFTSFTLMLFLFHSIPNASVSQVTMVALDCNYSINATESNSYNSAYLRQLNAIQVTLLELTHVITRPWYDPSGHYFAHKKDLILHHDRDHQYNYLYSQQTLRDSCRTQWGVSLTPSYWHRFHCLLSLFPHQPSLSEGFCLAN